MQEKKNIKFYDKAVRDRIPEIISKSGKKMIIKVVNNKVFDEYLERKLGEELAEYQESRTVDELVDIVEVIYGLLDMKGITVAEFERIRMEKVRDRGAFKERLVLKEVYEDF